MQQLVLGTIKYYSFVYLVSDPVMKHSNNGRSFTVRNQIKYFVDLIRVANRNLNRVTVVQRIQIHRSIQKHFQVFSWLEEKSPAMSYRQAPNRIKLANGERNRYVRITHITPHWLHFLFFFFFFNIFLLRLSSSFEQETCINATTKRFSKF